MMKKYSLTYLLILFSSSVLMAQEQPLIEELFLGIPVWADTSAIIASASERDEFQVEDCFRDAVCWSQNYHPWVSGKGLRVFVVLEKDYQKWEGEIAKLSIQIYTEDHKQDLERSFSNIRKRLNKAFGQSKKQKFFSTLVFGEKYIYYPKQLTGELSLNWMWSNCKRAERWIEIEYIE